MAHLTAEPNVIAENLDRARTAIAEACTGTGRDPSAVKICAATKYVDAEGLAALASAGIEIAAENRLQDLISKQELLGDRFQWHFIGAIQSRKVLDIARRTQLIHSLATTSARDKLASLGDLVPPVLVQVNVSGEQSKQGVDPAQLDEFIAGCDFEVCGFMTMPPASDDPEDARPYFRRLAQLASERGLSELSMGTSQDYSVAVEEGATLVRLGSVLFKPVCK